MRRHRFAALNLGVISDGLYKAENAYLRSWANILDFVMAFLFVCNNRFLLSLNMLRLIRLAMYFSNHNAGRLLKESFNIFRRTVMINLSIVGSMMVGMTFFAILAHSVLVVSAD